MFPAGVLNHNRGGSVQHFDYLGSVQPNQHRPEFHRNRYHWLVRRVHLRCSTKRNRQATG
jgi:hypothetical protein